MYSDKISNPINIDENIANAKARYFLLENTKWIADVIYIIASNTCLNTENGCAPPSFCCPSGLTIKNPGVPLTP